MTANGSDPAHLAVDDLGIVRGGRLVLRHISFQLQSGDLLTVRGRNGSGKSTLLRAVAGLIAPAAGGIRIDGRPLDADEPPPAPVYVGHASPVKPSLTVAENLRFWADLSGVGRRAETVTAALAHWGLGRLAEVPGRILSAGQRRRLVLARLDLAPARLWLLDEPTAALDRDGIAALEAALDRHRGAGGAALVATHDPDLAADGATLTLGDPR